MATRRTLIGTRKYGGEHSATLRKVARQCRKYEGRIVAREIEAGLHDHAIDSMDDGPHPTDHIAWDETIPGFTLSSQMDQQEVIDDGRDR